MGSGNLQDEDHETRGDGEHVAHGGGGASAVELRGGSSAVRRHGEGAGRVGGVGHAGRRAGLDDDATSGIGWHCSNAGKSSAVV